MKRWALGLAISLASTSLFAADKLIIISPHRKSIQQEFIPAFKDHYKKTFKTDVEVDWLDQGGTSDDVRFLKAKYAKNPKTSGVDVFWGGGSATFVELSQAGFLERYDLPQDLASKVPQTVAGIPLFDKTKTWYGSALSSFGIFYNKKILQFDRLPEPQSWDDLADPKFMGNISVADPRRSGSANTMNNIILQSKGWESGWQLLTSIAGNTRSFTHSSSDPIKAVVSGDVALAMAIDFYAQAKIGDLGPENLGFVMPKGQTVLDPDPVAILKGAPNREVAKRFVEYVLSSEAQKLLIMPKGSKGGPRIASLGRMSVNTAAYTKTEGQRINEFNPFKQQAFLTLDLEQATRMQRVFNDLVGAILVDTHHDLKKGWKKLHRSGATPEKIAAFAKPPLTEKEFLALADKWGDDVFRNKTINAWVSYAKQKYSNVK
ncbi:ABC transporter substrate-binding protein [Pseudobacteriovorax antillogorgiicola]|uniref:ABC-type Fe3+ transport system, substrate-binding protein n=1 Tax=Pseudobacteriovorax antillogorgiicola TaxID=1513793 RepID=A0A1Y6CTC5_9BACT|nr:extracellular solute-binding protein [Pseudobacteriovorax antillogorgiicola]TCS45008.1 ABC-type Fe3+ transport system substrate-binding protein [Pseudobacteriovorax antillogorgiicola]SMF76420.1 ABC-type Fe3+ transport system, substrate-binding protein [Pseudobacteriovorax antillogorgiicola]